ncbi:MAG: VWA domain-containing protein [Nanoarchaeota archaeon]|nr:VWA domain-containing protein [Nanoarchaeota archaeon]
MEIVFAKPVYLWVIGILPLLIFIHFYSLKHGKEQALRFANFDAIRRITGGEIVSKNVLLLLMRLIVVIFLIFAAAGTSLWYIGTSTDFELVIAMDASSSMLAEDYLPNRLEATKEAMLLFANNLPGHIDMGLVTFSGASYIQLQPTSDVNQIINTIKGVEIEKLGGTDIGQAIITSANIMNSDKPRAIVLLTDGQDNVGITPQSGLEYIKDDRIVVHTIGIGTKEGAPIGDISATFRLDEEGLREIADSTGGQYFKPTDEESLKEAFLAIANFRQSPIKKDLSLYLLAAAIFFLFVEWGLISTKYKII